MPKDNAPAPFELPGDLTTTSPEDLAALTETARTEFNGIYGAEGGPQAAQLARASELADAIDALNTENTRRTEEAAKTKADFDALAARITPADAAAQGDGTEPALEGEIVDAPAAPAPQPVAASGRPVGGAVTASRELGGLRPEPRINASLTAARTLAPKTTAPTAQLAITASADLPGTLTAGARIDSIDTLADLLEHRARQLPVTASGRRGHQQAYGGVNVARISHDYADVLAETASDKAVEAYRNKLMAGRRPQQMEAIVAAGGWCAPSEIRYDFFNIACAGGMIDLPTFGVQRGGIRWPISPSLADAYNPDLSPFEAAPSAATMPWLWTETSDVIAATGTLLKPCIRVPCSTMDEARLECYGVCVTAGNLAENAWPESTRNFLKLLDVAFQHTMNYRYIQTIRNLTTDIGTISCTGVGAASPLLDAVEFAAIDYRKRYVLCRDDVMEVILPDWIVGPLRADVARRTGVDLLKTTDADIMAWFDARHVRVQLVDDYQVRTSGLPGYSTPATAWPTTVEFMIYAPGTFALGNGMVLDLGVVRDSTLNETNDFTAAWYEQCHLIAKFGWAARRYTVNLCPSGVTGAANITACCL